MNLNLSYNSLTFVESKKEIFYNSEDFFDELCDYLKFTKILNHIDLSGLSFEKE